MGGGGAEGEKEEEAAPRSAGVGAEGVNEEKQGTIHLDVHKRELLAASTTGGQSANSGGGGGGGGGGGAGGGSSSNNNAGATRYMTVARARMVVNRQLPMEVSQRLAKAAAEARRRRKQRGEDRASGLPGNLVIGLVRLGMPTNKATVVNKDITVLASTQNQQQQGRQGRQQQQQEQYSGSTAGDSNSTPRARRASSCTGFSTRTTA